MVRVYQIQDRMMPGQWEGFGHRKVFINQQVESAIQNGARQVLVMGAGFDTLCLRLAPLYPHVQFFEVDHPATSAAKASGIARIGQPENMIQIAADLSENTLSNVLMTNDHWDASHLSVLVAEGLLQYLKDEEVHSLFTDAASCVPSASLILFTHAIPKEYRILQMILRLISEPFQSAVHSEDLPDYISGTGWTVASDVDKDPAHGIERYAVAKLN
jgi:methyltransferase (TIGR00027 family)